MTYERKHNYKAVLDYVINYKQDNDGQAPTIREIALGCQIASTSTVIYALDALEEDRLIQRIGEKSDARNILVVGGGWSFNGQPAKTTKWTRPAPAKARRKKKAKRQVAVPTLKTPSQRELEKLRAVANAAQILSFAPTATRRQALVDALDALDHFDRNQETARRLQEHAATLRRLPAGQRTRLRRPLDAEERALVAPVCELEVGL